MSPVSSPSISPVTPCFAVVAAAVSLLEQCRALVGELTIAAYSTESKTLAGGTIGKHIRHVLDHYEAVLQGVGTASTVNYDSRERNVPMESDPAAGIAALESTLERLQEIRQCATELPLRLRVMIAADGTSVELSSNLGRELAFATHHAVHHQAMIAAIAREFGTKIDTSFGKAPSTLRNELEIAHRRS